MSSPSQQPLSLPKYVMPFVGLAIFCFLSIYLQPSLCPVTPQFQSKNLPLGPTNSNTSECLLVFGAYKNGNLGDVAQPHSVINILQKTFGTDLCIKTSSVSYTPDPLIRVGELLTPIEDYAGDLKSGEYAQESANIVNAYGAFLIGGGGLLTDRHKPLDSEPFAHALRPDLPVAFLAVGAENTAAVKMSLPLLQRSVFVSVRDARSHKATTAVVNAAAAADANNGGGDDGGSSTKSVGNTTTNDSNEVLIVRDPILSDFSISDVDGTKCWSRWKADNPTCVILPGAGTKAATHKAIANSFEALNTRLINVFPKHLDRIKGFYENHGAIMNIIDPVVYRDTICDCNAIFSFRLHGTVYGLHGGIPTIMVSEGTADKRHSLMNDVLQLPDQFFLASNATKSDDVAQHIHSVIEQYEQHDRRKVIFEKIEGFYTIMNQLLLKHQKQLLPWYTANLQY